MNKVIITGVTGFIGNQLAIALLEKGVEVYGVGRNKAILEKLSINKSFHPIEAEFEDYFTLDQKIIDREFDVFFHIAHLGVNGENKNDYRIQLMNTTVSCDAVISAKRLGCKRFLFAGSVDEYEACIKPDAQFIMPSHSRIYGITKFAAENIGKIIALNYDIEFVGAILALTFGEGNKTNILPNTIIRNSEKGTPLKLISGNTLFDMNYIDETIGGLIAIAEKGINLESYYVGHHELLTFKDVVFNVCTILKSNCELRFGEYPDPDYNVDYSSINRQKLYKHTGYKCEANFEDSILKTREWLRKVD